MLALDIQIASLPTNFQFSFWKLRNDGKETSSKVINRNIFHVLLYWKKILRHHDFAGLQINVWSIPWHFHFAVHPKNNISCYFNFACLEQFGNFSEKMRSRYKATMPKHRVEIAILAVWHCHRGWYHHWDQHSCKNIVF